MASGFTFSLILTDFSERARIPFLIRFLKADGLEHALALRVEGIDIRRYPLHFPFSGELQHIQNAAPPDMPVLKFLADHDRDLYIIAQGNVANQRTPVFYVVAAAVRVQIVVHAVQPLQIVGRISIVHLPAYIRILIPWERRGVVSVIGNQPDLIIYNTFFCHSKRSPLQYSPDTTLFSAHIRFLPISILTSRRSGSALD